MRVYANDIEQRNAPEINNYLTTDNSEEIKNEMIRGLNSSPKYISSKFFYDHYGSKLFEKITDLKEYYPTRIEKSILTEIAPNILADSGITEVIELGSGDCSKISMLFENLNDNELERLTYYPVDVSASAIEHSAENLAEHFPSLEVEGYVADFMAHLDELPGAGKRLICFFGSTIGNLPRKVAFEFVRELQLKMNPGDQLLLGLDMVKDIEILEHAYNDSSGVTAEFNMNILRVINRTLEANFSLKDFEHLAFYNAEDDRIEMHLKANKNLTITSPFFPNNLYLKKDETIHTENSHKFSLKHIHNMAHYSGLTNKNTYTDKNRWFSLVHFVKP